MFQGDEGSSGRVTRKNPPFKVAYGDVEYTGDHYYRLHAELIIFLCGLYAEGKLVDMNEALKGAKGDLDQISELLFAVEGNEESAQALYDYLHVKAKKLVDVRWIWIEKIAQALMKKKKLFENECYDAIKSQNDT